MENVNYLLLFNITVQESHQISSWSGFFERANAEAQKHRPKSTLMPSKKFDELQREIKALEETVHSENFTNFIERQRREMQELQIAKTEKIKEDLRYLDEEKLKDPAVLKALCAEYKEFQITEDVIISLIQTVIKENKNNTSEEDFSNYLSKAEAKAIDTLIVDAGFGEASLYEILGVDSRTPIEDIKKAAEDRSNAETTKISLNHTRQKLFGQCLKIFKTNESKTKYDNYLRISRYKKINSHIESPFKYTSDTSISETVASKIITQAVKDYPSMSRAQVAEYIKKYCGFWGYKITIAPQEFIYTAPLQPEKKDDDVIGNLLRNAEIMLKQADLADKARAVFEEITKVAPDDYRGWLGIARAITLDFTLFEATARNNAFEYIKCALNVAGNNRRDVEAKWNKYLQSYENYKNQTKKELNTLYHKVGELNSQIEQQEKEQKVQEAKLIKLQKKMERGKVKFFSLILKTVSSVAIFMLARLFHEGTLYDIQDFGYSWDIYLEIAITIGVYLLSVFMVLTPIRTIFKAFRAKKTKKKHQAALEVYRSLMNDINKNKNSRTGMYERINYLKNMLNMC